MIAFKPSGCPPKDYMLTAIESTALRVLRERRQQRVVNKFIETWIVLAGLGSVVWALWP